MKELKNEYQNQIEEKQGKIEILEKQNKEIKIEKEELAITLNKKFNGNINLLEQTKKEKEKENEVFFFLFFFFQYYFFFFTFEDFKIKNIANKRKIQETETKGVARSEFNARKAVQKRDSATRKKRTNIKARKQTFRVQQNARNT